MTKHLFFLALILAFFAGGAVVVYRKQNNLVLNPFAVVPDLHAPDAFDHPSEVDSRFQKHSAIQFPFKANDRVTWIGSSSTYIGVWSQTVEFLLKTRHPELNLTFARHSTGSGTYAEGLKRLPDWLERSQPNIVFFNYGANDALYGERGIESFHSAMRDCTELAQRSGARVFHLTPQAGDMRVSGEASLFRRKHYAEDMLAFGAKNGWAIIDVFHPLEALQLKQQGTMPAYTINSDIIHLTDSAYVAWGFLLYDSLNPPQAESRLELDASSKKMIAALNCSARVIESDAILTFEREDNVLPILPPNPIPASNRYREIINAQSAFGQINSDDPSAQKMPPWGLVPLEERSRYMLKIMGLPPGFYRLECNGSLCEVFTQEAFATGINLNSIAYSSDAAPPWNDLALKVWNGSRLNELPGRKLTFKVIRHRSNP